MKKFFSILSLIFITCIILIFVGDYAISIHYNNLIYRIVPKSDLGYSFANSSRLKHYHISSTYSDFLEKISSAEESLQWNYNYFKGAKGFSERGAKFYENEFDKLSMLKKEISEDFFETKNVLFIPTYMDSIRFLSSEIHKVTQEENQLNVIIDLNYPEEVSFISEGVNLHVLYIDKNITNVTVSEIHKSLFN